MSKQVVGDEHRLCTLHVRVARHVGVPRLARADKKSVLHFEHRTGRHEELPLGEQSQIGCHLVVAAPPCMELRPHVPRYLGDPAFDRRVDVFVGRLELEGAFLELLVHTFESSLQDRNFLLVQDARPSQTSDVCTRPFEVVAREKPVERQARRELDERRRSAAPEAAFPQGHRPSWRRAHVVVGRPHRRTKPSAS